MEMTGAPGIEFSAHLRRNGNGDELARLRMVIEPFKQPVHPWWDFCPAHRREFSRLGKIGDRQDAGYDLSLNSRRHGAVAKAEKNLGREKELRNRPARPGVDLRLEIFQVRCPAG